LRAVCCFHAWDSRARRLAGELGDKEKSFPFSVQGTDVTAISTLSLRLVEECFETEKHSTMNNDSDDDGPPQLVDVAPVSPPGDRPRSPSDQTLPRVPITIVTGTAFPLLFGLLDSKPVDAVNWSLLIK
jgi:hypothetical protein